MKIITLTKKNSSKTKMYVNVDAIAFFERSGSYTMVHFIGDKEYHTMVLEKPEDLLELLK